MHVQTRHTGIQAQSYLATLLLCSFGVFFSPQARCHAAVSQTQAVWKAGLARVVITPEHSMWMAGYAARTKPSEGKVHDLYAKALALEDSQATRLVIVTADIIGFPREFRRPDGKGLREAI